MSDSLYFDDAPPKDEEEDLLYSVLCAPARGIPSPMSSLSMAPWPVAGIRAPPSPPLRSVRRSRGLAGAPPPPKPPSYSSTLLPGAPPPLPPRQYYTPPPAGAPPPPPPPQYRASQLAAAPPPPPPPPPSDISVGLSSSLSMPEAPLCSAKKRIIDIKHFETDGKSYSSTSYAHSLPQSERRDRGGLSQTEQEQEQQFYQPLSVSSMKPTPPPPPLSSVSMAAPPKAKLVTSRFMAAGVLRGRAPQRSSRLQGAAPEAMKAFNLKSGSWF